MKIYNTYSRKIENIDLKQEIKIYVCGITPYDTTHIGHAFTFVVYDALIRYLKFLSTRVKYVQNVTDIDDDILIRSKAVNKSWKQLGIDETNSHLKNMDALGATRPDFFPKATDNIPHMIKIIKKLISKKLAYVSGGNVYFEVNKDKSFGKLSRFGYSAMLEIANERGNFPLDRHKKDPLDFVLWQKRHEDEPYWTSPWGIGRPGWHVECSAMSMRYLGETISIHGGGSDLIFPHHEAEIAQSENYSDKKFVKCWMHIAMVYYEGKKMSKSLGNMVFVHDLLKKYDKNTIRICLLFHHYRSPWEFEETHIEKCKEIKQNFESTVGEYIAPKGVALREAREFFSYLDNDFQTDKAIDVLVKLTKENKIKPEVLNTCLNTLGIYFND